MPHHCAHVHGGEQSMSEKSRLAVPKQGERNPRIKKKTPYAKVACTLYVLLGGKRIVFRTSPYLQNNGPTFRNNSIKNGYVVNSRHSALINNIKTLSFFSSCTHSKYTCSWKQYFKRTPLYPNRVQYFPGRTRLD